MITRNPTLATCQSIAYYRATHNPANVPKPRVNIVVELSSSGKRDNESPVLKAYTLCRLSVSTAIICDCMRVGRSAGGKNARIRAVLALYSGVVKVTSQLYLEGSNAVREDGTSEFPFTEAWKSITVSQR
ncbi:hypothetical protein RRG08_007233 [Elysia crispata]|uniref:Uncharacterized protein n=1 Tax=Elysia crispata TaxID=231223 RepID=A0AAE0ZSR5_9GAST|nr:hypothetical protein RRG08_007233 [Elysia crispata]